MTEGVSSASLIAAAFGPGAVRRIRPKVGPVSARDPGGLQPIQPGDHTQPAEQVELTSPVRGTYEANPPVAYDAQGGPIPAPTDVRAAPSKDGSPEERTTADEERQQVDELKERDHKVRRHEQAHIAASGQYVRGGARMEYETGPDGKRYATGGEVLIDTSRIPSDPAGTIRKMQTVRRAALAPAEPSPTDRRIAAEAQAKENQARLELQARNDETEDVSPPSATSDIPASADPGRDEKPSDTPDNPGPTERTERGPPAGPTLLERVSLPPAPASQEDPTHASANRTADVPRVRPPRPRYASLDGIGHTVDLVA